MVEPRGATPAMIEQMQSDMKLFRSLASRREFPFIGERRLFVNRRIEKAVHAISGPGGKLLTMPHRRPYPQRGETVRAVNGGCRI